MCLPNGLLFHQKSLDMGPILVKKSFEESSITHNLRKMVKSAFFEAAKPFIEMGLDLQNFEKKNCLFNRFCFVLFFEQEKSPQIWVGVLIETSGRTLRQKIIRVSPPTPGPTPVWSDLEALLSYCCLDVLNGSSMQTYNVKMHSLIYLDLTQIDITGVTLKVFNMPMADYRNEHVFCHWLFYHSTEQITYLILP